MNLPKIRFPWKRRKVTLDANTIISGLRDGKNGETTTNKVLKKSVTEDELMLTNVIFIEVDRYVETRTKGDAKDKMKGKLERIAKDVIAIELPPDAELKRMYRIRDDDDYKILYSADVTGSEVLVTGDDDFHDPKTKGPENVRIVRPREYLNEKRKRRLFGGIRR